MKKRETEVREINKLYILRVRSGKEQEFIENINLELSSKVFSKNVKEFKVLKNSKGDIILKGYIILICWSDLSRDLLNFFYSIPFFMGFINYKREKNSIPDSISQESIKKFSNAFTKDNKYDKILKANELDKDLKIGDLIRINKGFFYNQEGTILDLEKNGKISIKITFADRNTSISIPIKYCEKVFK